MTTEAQVVELKDGARLAVFTTLPENEEAQASIPILCLHGNGGSHGSFWQVIAALGDEHPIIAPDMRAQGVSSRGTKHLTYELLADDALEVLDALNVERAVVLGYSDGGIEALILARDHADRIAGIVTLGANLTPEGVVEENPGAMEADEATYLSLANDLPRAKDQAELLRLMIDEPQIEAASLNSISCPATIMAGEFDLIAEEETKRIASAIANSKLVIVPEAGHGLMKDAPEVVEEELRAILLLTK